MKIGRFPFIFKLYSFIIIFKLHLVISSSVIVYILDSDGLRGYNPLKNVRYRDPMMRQPMSNGSNSVNVP
jgi:hypothetical protein